MPVHSKTRRQTLEEARFLLEFTRGLIRRNLQAVVCKQCKRRAPVSDWLDGKDIHGAFKHQVTHLLDCGTDEQLKRFIGLNFEELHILYEATKKKLAPKKKANKKAICAKEQLLMTLSFLRGGWSMSYHCSYWMVSRWTLMRVLRKVCPVICEFGKLHANFTPESPADWERVARGFEKKWQLPHCVGAIDGKHVRVVKFNNSGSLLMNYKSFHSIILLAVVDSNYRLLHFNVGSPGIRSDGGVWCEDRLGSMVRKGTIELPEPRPLPKDRNNDCGDCPFFFAADDAFTLGPHVMKPYKGDNLTDEQAHYNYRLSRARMVVECCFGHLSKRFGVLNYITADRDLAILLVRACCYLHNFLRVTRSDDEKELELIRNRGRKLDFRPRHGAAPQGGHTTRDMLTRYVNQHDYMQRRSEAS